MNRRFWQIGAVAAMLTIAASLNHSLPESELSGFIKSCRQSEGQVPQASGHPSSGSTLALAPAPSTSTSRYQGLSDCLPAALIAIETPATLGKASVSAGLAASSGIPCATRGRAPPSA